MSRSSQARRERRARVTAGVRLPKPAPDLRAESKNTTSCHSSTSPIVFQKAWSQRPSGDPTIASYVRGEFHDPGRAPEAGRST